MDARRPGIGPNNIAASSEVKGKSGPGFGDPLEMVEEEKMRRLHQAAETWLARNTACRRLDCRFEVVALRGRTLERSAV
jgi:Holliday junction resolvase-like predicted endonuclease